MRGIVCPVSVVLLGMKGLGWWQALRSPVCVPALELLKTAIAKAGYTDKVVIGMDVAASEFYRDGKYDLDFKSPDDPSRYISPDQLADLYKGFVKNYPGKLLLRGKHSSGGWGLVAGGGSWCAAPLTGDTDTSCLAQPLGLSGMSWAVGSTALHSTPPDKSFVLALS